MKWHLCLVITCLLMASFAWAQEGVTPPPLVEVYHDESSVAPYRERRATNGFMFSANYTGFLPKDYISTLDFVSYKDIFGKKPIPLVEVQLAYKYNFALGSITGGLGYGIGSLSADYSGAKRSISVNKPSVSLAYIMDALAPEPYLAPYLQFQAWQMHIKESSPTDSFEADTKIGFDYTLGALIQLNWLDAVSARSATRCCGLENTYLDLYVAKYTKTQGSVDADTETDFTYGGGLRLEF